MRVLLRSTPGEREEEAEQVRITKRTRFLAFNASTLKTMYETRALGLRQYRAGGVGCTYATATARATATEAAVRPIR